MYKDNVISRNDGKRVFLGSYLVEIIDPVALTTAVTVDATVAAAL
jgi:hypothetical protein